jgi:plastocyanin
MTTHEVKIISSGPNGFSPAFLRIEPGDSVVWNNLTDMEHTATAMPGQQYSFDVIIDPESTSLAEKFSNPSPQSGIEYFCRNHPSMHASLVVQPNRKVENGQVSVSANSTLTTFPDDVWNTMAHIVCVMWILDMVDDFEFSTKVHRTEDNDKVKNSLSTIETWWQGLIGLPKATLSDRDQLLRESISRLEVLGRKLRVEYANLRPLVFRSPQPLRPDDVGGPDVLYPGQSSDEFGKAITVNHANAEVQRIEPLEEAMAGPAYGIERRQDMSIPIEPEFQKQHDDAKALILPEHYAILADHLTRGLSKLFGSTQFDETIFLAGVTRMTRRGEWDAPAFVGWHWMRWIQSYLEVTSSGVVPNMYRPMPPT